MLFPIYWIISSSFKSEVDMFVTPPIWIPLKPTLENYQPISEFVFGVWTVSIESFVPGMINSLIVSSVATPIIAVTGALAGYSFSRYRFRGGKLTYIWFVLMRMFPPITCVLPIYLLYSQVQLVNTLTGLILVYVAFNIPFATWFMKSFFDGIPKEIDESAKVDGCTDFGALFRIIIPLGAPGFIVVTIFCFLACWNEFMFAAIFISNPGTMTLPLKLAGAVSSWQTSWPFITAGSTIAMIPPFLFVMLAQRYIVQGLTFGAVKG